MSDSNNKILLSVRNMQVKFRVRGHILSAIRNVSLDIYKGESIAIVGESGSGKSVFTKAFSGMLDSNGFIDSGQLLFYDEELSDTVVKNNKKAVEFIERRLNDFSGGSENESVNKIIAREIYLSAAKYNFPKRCGIIRKLLGAFEDAYKVGNNPNNENIRREIIENVTPRVKYAGENEKALHGSCLTDLAQFKTEKDWLRIRGSRIASVFQDPMTSLNPIITIGKQITSIIIKHQHCREEEARSRALNLMRKVGITDPQSRFNDYPFQYSGGMRQRIVIAIALSCQPEILICDEPTTALDVTIQAQILKLIKDLQKEFGFAIVFITHDLGVAANIADRIAVMYAGQIIELGTTEDIFYDPRHPYTWALLSGLPQLSEKNTKLYSINGSPPSLYNEIKGDAFAPRNPYCMKVDTIYEPPMFKVSDTHYARTWLLDKHAPKAEKPEAICDIHNKLIKEFNIREQNKSGE